jgi:CubicO group peptidase (beta-lactamase class C family)
MRSSSSATKSVNNVLLGILARQGKLKMEHQAPVAAWQTPGDPRRAITPDQMLRLQSGLDLGDSLTASFSTAWDTSARPQRHPGDRLKSLSAASYSLTLALRTTAARAAAAGPATAASDRARTRAMVGSLSFSTQG